MIAIII